MAELITLTQCAVIWMRHSICQRDLRDEKKSHAYDAKHIETYVTRKGDHCWKLKKTICYTLLQSFYLNISYISN